ncbi:DegV family protein [Proteiniborus sp. MB09-C3]|uniref:DegV family protein n=1 Tax=Proteiniborus sp. MB09-C3 TaxID=3050072 RepID=UPI0025558A0C|nr:DegV family protein [Proteiniborus sp. MB09-C3]WIV11607.1 DegV family protein [Proteiniborus sp. MB09-C3]
MKFKIIADSCCDFNEELRESVNINLVPLTIHIGDRVYVDDMNLDKKELLRVMSASETAPQTASPSPGDFIREYEDGENVFVVTLSSMLSSTHNHAMMAKKIVLEDLPNKFIHVFDSLSASVGETLVSLKILETLKNEQDPPKIVERVNEYIKSMKTFFVLESLENLIKSGRISSLKGKLASLLSIKPIMRGTENGEIALVENVRGSKKALKRLVDVIGEQGEKLEDRILGIAHCNCLEKAMKFKEEVQQRYNFKDIIIVETAGISTVYANDGGLIIAF